jgi:replication-associated recombination protein RarA
MKGIVCIDNPDKGFHETWHSVEGKVRHPINIPHPFRGVLLGPPGVGKTTVAINLVMFQDPIFETVYVIHVDGDYTKEYDSLGNYKLLKSIPSPDWWPGDKKALVILDDLEYRMMNKLQKQNIDRLFGFVSTHKNISVVLTAQDPFNVPPNLRRCADIWVLWKSKDLDAVATIARKTGIKSSDMRQIFKQFDTTDSLWIDTTKHTPYPLRINGVELIRLPSDEETDEEDAAPCPKRHRSDADSVPAPADKTSSDTPPDA